MNVLPVFRAQGFAKRLHFGDNLFAVDVTEFVVFITKILPGMPQKQPAVFNLARCKHGLNDG
jgi:hypothetical protein